MIAQNKKTRRFFLPAGFNPYDCAEFQLTDAPADTFATW